MCQSHNILGDDNYSQKHALLLCDFWRLCEMCSYAACGGGARGLCSCMASSLSENHMKMGHVFRGCRGHGSAFSEAISRMKNLCNLELPRIAHRGLSREREYRLKASGTWHILGITHKIGVYFFE